MGCCCCPPPGRGRSRPATGCLVILMPQAPRLPPDSRRAGQTTWFFVLCALSGALYASLFPPLGWNALAWVALVPFFVACSRLTPLQAAGGGLLWALAATIGIAWWLPETLSRYFSVSPTAAWAGFAAIGVVMDGLPYAALGAWLAWLSRRRAPSGWAVGAAWAVAEWARVHAWLGNPFGLLAYSLHETPFAQLADLAGPYGVGALVAGVNGSLASVVAAEWRPTRPRLALAGAAATLVAAFAYGELRLTQPVGEGPPIRVAVVQTGIARERTGNPALSDSRLERTLALTRVAAKARPDLIFWPEFSIDFYLRDPTRERDELLAAARGLDTELVLGAPDYRMAGSAPAQPHFYNSVFLLRGGELAGRHDKLRLVPFAEYGPLGDFLRADTALYEPGEAPGLLDARRARIGAFLCGEALYPDLVRALVRAGSELLANPSNDDWLGEPSAAAQQVQIAAFRAIESRRWVVRATPTGTSAVIDAHGRVRAASRFKASDLLHASVYRSHVLSPYQLIGDAGCGLALALVVGFSCSSALRRSTNRAWR